MVLKYRSILLIINCFASHMILTTWSSASSSANMLFIRHGRSRVRHSNEKDHIRWGLKAFDNLTLDYETTDGYENETTMSLFGSDLWASLDFNGSFINQTEILQQQNSSDLFGKLLHPSTTISDAVSSPYGYYDEKTISRMTTQPSQSPTTSTIKKKLAKKKIMENIRKNVDKGLEYLKTHKNLDKDPAVLSVVGRMSHELNVDEYQNDAANTGGLNSREGKTKSPVPVENIESLSSKITNSDGAAIFSSFESEGVYNDRNLPHSVPARLSVTYQQQLAGREEPEGNGTKFLKNVNVNVDNKVYNNENNNLSSSISASGLTSSNFPSSGGQQQQPEHIQETIEAFGEMNSAGQSSLDIENIAESTGSEDDIETELVPIGNDGSPITNIYGTDEDLTDLDEISRNNRLNLMKGRDVVTRFLQIVESQHLLGANCTAGTALNLGEGVVDQYAQDRFRVEAEVAVNRANMLTRIFKFTAPAVQASEHLLHASVLSMVEFDDDIFAAGHCFDWNQHPVQAGLFCPFAHRLPPPDQSATLAKDLSSEYHYLGNTSEWFFQARKNAEKVVARNEQYIKAFHLYSNSTTRESDEILSVKYEDGKWSKPYYDCGGGNIWMLTYTVPFFGYENGTYFFKGTSGIDIDLRRVDIDQCPQKNSPGTMQPLNIFAGTDKCKQRTTMCEAITGLGFRRGSYKCVCRKGFYFPDTAVPQKYFNGSILEEEYEKLMLFEDYRYSEALTYECFPCAEGCDYCEDASPCVAALNWPMRTSILVLACAVIGLLPPAAWFTFRYQQVKVVRAASPALLRVIALGAFFIYCTTILMYPPPSLYTCTARIWLREIGFSLTYGALMLKTWRISVIFRVRSAKAVKITDAALLKRLGVICGAIGVCLLVRTVVSPPEVVVGRTADDLKAFLCRTDWWDYTFTSMEVLFLAWGVRLCIMVRKAPSEFNESRFISMAIYNEFLLTCFLNVSMLFLQSPANPDLLYIIFFCHTQLTITLLLGLIFGSKVYIVLRSGKSQENSIGLGAKASGAKFNFRPQIRTFANPSTATSSTAQLADAKLTDQEALEEIRQLSIQLLRIQELAPPRGVAATTISSLLDGLKGNSHQLALKPASTSNQLTPNSHPTAIATVNCEQKIVTIATKLYDKSINTSLTGDSGFWRPSISNTEDGSCCIRKMGKLCQNCTQITITDCDNQPAGSQSTRYSDQITTATISQASPSHPLSSGEQAAASDLSFANLQLDCMCSDTIDDNDYADRRTDERYKHKSVDCLDQQCTKQQSTADRDDANNTTTIIKPESTNRKYYSSCNLIQQSKFNNSTNKKCDNHKSNDHFLICDNCKKKIVKKSIELSLDSRYLVDPNYDGEQQEIFVHNYDGKTKGKMKHVKTITSSSHDDLSFHSTDDDRSFEDCSSSDHPRSPSSGNLRRQNADSRSDGKSKIARNRKTDKLVIDLNDRSKYTKEVSV